MKPVLAKLTGGDRRTVRGVEEVVAMVTVDPALFGDLVEGMLADNPLIRMRVAQFFLRLPLSLAERRAAVKLLNGYLGDESRGRRLLAKLRR